MMPSSRDDYLEFVLVAVNEPVDYFVSVGGGPADGAASRFNSDRFRIEVADLPRVEGMEIRLDFPAWTRLEPRTQDHGDVAGVDGTRVALRIEANLPLEDAHLVVNGEQRELDDGVGDFMIDGPGTWHVAVTHRGEVVRISDEYLIDLIHDAPPEVEFTFPGRDRSATAIEEVALPFSGRGRLRHRGLDPSLCRQRRRLEQPRRLSELPRQRQFRRSLRAAWAGAKRAARQGGGFRGA